MLRYLTICLLVVSLYAVGQPEKEAVKTIIEVFKSKNPEQISEYIAYPLRRTVPIPPVNNKKEFVSRFKEIFDKTLIDLIVNSNIDKDWNTIGSNGTMLHTGVVWIRYDGKVSAVNYQTEEQKRIKTKIIKDNKEKLHKSINIYSEPVLKWNTKKFHIRIDKLEDGGFRYASWGIIKVPNEKPDLVLFNGKMEFDGSGGNHTYTFTSGPYAYKCNVTLIGKGLGNLEVYQNGQRILQDAVIKILEQ